MRAITLSLSMWLGACRGGVPEPPVDTYEARSDFLLDPSLNIELVTDTVRFLEHGRDDVNGGYHVYLADDGTPVMPQDAWWGSEQCGETFDYHLRPVFSQSRVAYAFAKAFMLTGDVAYLDEAEHALAFLYAHGKDEEDGGWWFTTDEQGGVAPWMPCEEWDPNEWKWSFSQFYPLLGVRAVTEATLGASEGGRATGHWQELEDGLALLDAFLWDDREPYLGYYDEADLDWENPRGKGFTGPADGITTHAASVYLQTGEEAHRQRVLDLADGLVDHLAPSIALGETAFGFAEVFDANWQLDRTNTGGFVGHMMKASWCLARAYQLEPDPAYREAGKIIFDEVWGNGGYDHANGGIFTEFDWRSGRVESRKNHWNLEQGFTGGITSYHVAEEPSDRAHMLQMADESLDFFMTRLRDPADGVAWSDTDAGGVPTDRRKGHIWKAGYHDVELGYLAYVYGSLYFAGEPITLHYLAMDDGTDRSMVLNPVEDAGLVITAVALDGATYEGFEPATRRLSVPAGVSGVFAVTFELPAG